MSNTFISVCIITSLGLIKDRKVFGLIHFQSKRLALIEEEAQI